MTILSGALCFFSTIAIVSSKYSSGTVPAYMAVLSVLLPLAIGAVIGGAAGFALKPKTKKCATTILMCAFIISATVAGIVVNKLLPDAAINFMLVGMAFSAFIANMISEERLKELMIAFNPILNFAMIAVILNLGAPLDYHLIFGAGIFTLVYILSRAFGKYFGAFFGSAVTKSPKSVRNYLGFTLLPHSGVSLVFTGIAVSTLNNFDIGSAKIIQGTIAAAAVLNEIIAVIVAKKGFEWAEEFNK